METELPQKPRGLFGGLEVGGPQSSTSSALGPLRKLRHVPNHQEHLFRLQEMNVLHRRTANAHSSFTIMDPKKVTGPPGPRQVNSEPHFHFISFALSRSLGV